ncbi:hypothetical protein [Litorimonas taeanensis]|uniref:hypothetical protein n=1 Tax=Litorimonas taeanensis TaxID=568099 RepID=UPI001F160C05|nr:hypothetical protein [Litorimonas taeanensis]
MIDPVALSKSHWVSLCRNAELSAEKQTPEIDPWVAGCVKDGRRMAETAKRAWFTTA